MAAAVDSSMVHPFLLHCVEAGDIFGAAKISVCLDTTRYPSGALMQPTYDGLQGPALCVVLHDVCLKPDELVQLFTPAGSPDAHVINNRRMNGQGLAMAFEFAVAVACVSGSTLTLLDPAGFYLKRHEEADTAAGVGQMYNFAQTPILMTHFQDQFRPFYPHGLLPPQGMTPGFSQDTIIRIPLRTNVPAPWLNDENPAPLPTIGSMMTLLEAASHVYTHALVVSCSLQELRLSCYHREQSHILFQATIESNAAALEARSQLMKMDNYGGVSGWLSKTYDPVSVEYSVNLHLKPWTAPVLESPPEEDDAVEPTVVQPEMQLSNEQWYVVQQLGDPKSRALAADAFSSTRLCPRVCASVRLTENDQLTAPGTGTCFGAGCIFEAPLPVSLQATLFPFGSSTNHAAVRSRFTECSEFNQAQMVSLSAVYATLLAHLVKTRPIAANPIKLYQWFWPQPDRFQPGGFKSYLNGFYPELLKLLLKGEFYRMDGNLVKMKDGMVLARDAPSELRSFMAKTFPDCLQLPVEQVVQLRSVDSGRLYWIRISAGPTKLTYAWCVF
jgi:hypothetical protein